MLIIPLLAPRSKNSSLTAAVSLPLMLLQPPWPQILLVLTWGAPHLANDATFLLSDRTITVPGSQLMAAAHPYFISHVFAFMAYPNCDSVPYQEWYGIGEAEMVVRASLRYQGLPSL